MNLFQYLFGGMEGRMRFYILLFYFVLATGSIYVTNSEDVNYFFTSLFSKSDVEVKVPMNTWVGFSPMYSDSIIVMPKRYPYIKSVADLKGQKIAVAKETYPHTLLLRVLETAGLNQSDVELVPCTDGIEAAK